MTNWRLAGGKALRIFLYGPPGSGKSSVGHALAKRLGLPAGDLDCLIEQEAGCSIPEIFAREGEEGFRMREAEALRRWIHNDFGVLALGGGSLLRAKNLELASRSGRIICLMAPEDVLFERVMKSPAARPLIPPDDMYARLRRLLEARRDHYAGFSPQVETGGRSIEETAAAIQDEVGWFHTGSDEGGTDILVLENGLEYAGELLRQRGGSGKIALVSDDIVMPLYGRKAAASLAAAGFEVLPVTIPTGETHKTLQTVSGLWEAFVAGGLERGNLVVALGGGVVCDLAGFAAATYMRGIRWAAMPTTLLAMVDAGIGGKTGADLPVGKNLVGAFHPPLLTLADPVTLNTLPEEEWRCGMAETVKHGLLADPFLFGLCEQLAVLGMAAVPGKKFDTLSLLKRSIAVKTRFVQADPFEKGERAALNLGHTIGHAIEMASGYRIRHGEAVAIGIVIEARIAERLSATEHGLVDRISAVLLGLGLPVTLPAGLEANLLLDAIQRDKKCRDGAVRFALPVSVGRYWLTTPPAEIVSAVLRGEG